MNDEIRSRDAGFGPLHHLGPVAPRTVKTARAAALCCEYCSLLGFAVLRADYTSAVCDIRHSASSFVRSGRQWRPSRYRTGPDSAVLLKLTPGAPPLADQGLYGSTHLFKAFGTVHRSRTIALRRTGRRKWAYVAALQPRGVGAAGDSPKAVASSSLVAVVRIGSWYLTANINMP